MNLNPKYGGYQGQLVVERLEARKSILKERAFYIVVQTCGSMNTMEQI